LIISDKGEEVTDAGGGVLHHQFAGGVVVFGAAVADTSQQVIDLVTETALRQSYVQQVDRVVGIYLKSVNNGNAKQNTLA
jgi:monoamine oxidase